MSLNQLASQSAGQLPKQLDCDRFHRIDASFQAHRVDFITSAIATIKL